MPLHRNDNDRRVPDYDEGNAIGLTRAFSPVGDEASAGGSDAGVPSAFDTAAFRVSEPLEGARALTEEELDRDEARRSSGRGKHARHARPEPKNLGASSEEGLEISDFDETPCPSDRDEVPEYLRKSQRMRRVLIGVIVVLVVLLAAGAFFTWQLVQTAQTAAVQQAQNAGQSTSSVPDADGVKDASTATARTTTVPNRVSLLGKTQQEAIDALAHGAQVSSVREVNEEENPVKSEARIVLTEEASDSLSGAPTVYAGMNEEGLIVQVGYSAPTSALGFGSLSFADAVRNEHIIEKTLAEAGVTVTEGSVSLPDDKMSYSTYATDGTTLTREYASFAGEASIDGASHAWSAVLSYDYATANATGNLANTVRTVFVYVNA